MMTQKQPRHFLTLQDLSKAELQTLINRAIELKKMQHAHELHAYFEGYTLGMIFEKASTRTRLSFEVGMSQFGGHAVFLSPKDTQLGRGEPLEDSARVISSMVDAVMIRTFEHEKIQTFARYSSKPVINGLTDAYHPCQLLADVMTFVEKRGSIQGKKVVWIGDGNNMCHSYINAAERFDFNLVIAAPSGYEPDPDLLAKHADRCELVQNFEEAVKGAHLISTDVWTSMGQEEESAKRLKDFSGFQVTEAVLDKADPEVLLMHCLPAHRGEEVNLSVLDDPRSVVFEQAQNRLHAQKALLELLLKS